MTHSISPGLTELLRIAMDLANEELFIAGPAKIVTYDADKQLANVLPLTKRHTTDKDGQSIIDEVGQINNVRVMHPRGGGFYTHFPLKPGNNILLIYCDRSIEEFMESSGSEVLLPEELRTNDPSDAVAISGFYPDNKALKDVDGDNLTIGHEPSGAKIMIETNGAVDINGGNLRVII